MNNRLLLFFIALSIAFVVPRVSMAQEHHDHDHHEHEEGLHVNKDMQKTIGMTFEKAQLRDYFEKIKVYGEIAQDTDKYTHITSESDGTIQDIYVQAGSIIDPNEPILSIIKDDGSVETMMAPHHGTIIAMHVKSGDKVDHLKSLASLADLDLLRVSFDVYEKDLRFVSVGQIVNVYSTAYPDKAFKGTVVFVSPRIEKHTQTIKIRAEVENYDHLLRLGMFVTGDLIYLPGTKVLSVSQSAVQQIGDENVVFIPKGDEFEEKDIEVGREFNNFVEVKSGLREGDVVVSKGSFALKSEMQKGAFGDGHNH